MTELIDRRCAAKPRLQLSAALALGVIGCVARWLLREHTTVDTGIYLLPWYNYAREHGLAALDTGFTNYTPFYSYLLIAATRFEGLAPPLSLIKGISGIFEAGCAAMAGGIIYTVTGDRYRGLLGAAAVWTAPTVLFNGAAWGQADSIWAFFELIAIWLFLKGGNGVLPFAAAIAVKAQGVFLGPFVLGEVLRRRAWWPWLAAIPAVYLLFALPAVLMGRPLGEILAVYFAQAETFHVLSMNAGSVWILLPRKFSYPSGVVIGMVLAAVAGLSISLKLSRSLPDRQTTLLAATLSLLLMPYLLPKMHDRYFYAYELAILTLAIVNPRYLWLAVLAQIGGVLCYVRFELRHLGLGLDLRFIPMLAAIANGAAAAFLAIKFARLATTSIAADRGQLGPA